MILNSAASLDEFQKHFMSSAAFDEFTESTAENNKSELIANRFQPGFIPREIHRTSSAHPQTIIIIGGFLGGFVGLVLLVVLICYIWRRIKEQNDVLQSSRRVNTRNNATEDGEAHELEHLNAKENCDGGQNDAETAFDSLKNDADDQSKSNEFNPDLRQSLSSSETNPPENLPKSRQTKSENDVDGMEASSKTGKAIRRAMTVPRLASGDSTEKPPRAENNKLNERRAPSPEIIPFADE